MVHEEHALKTAGGTELFAERWVPNGRPRAALALVHGFGEHVGRYAHAGEKLAREGCALCGVDLPGHGRTKGKRGCASRESLLEAADLLVASAKERFPGVPVFLYGHSMGGAVVILRGLARPPAAPPAVAGVIASSPLVRLGGRTPAWKAAVARILSRAMPTFTMKNPLDLSALSRDPAVEPAARADPLYHNTVSTRLGWDIMEWCRRLEAAAGPFPVPLLVMTGTRDRIVDPAATAALAGRLTGDVTLKSWEGLYHELHNEPEKGEVLAFMVSWLKAHGA